MGKIINIGILGCSDFAERTIIPMLISMSDKFKIVGIASRSEDKSNHFAEKFNINPFVGYDKLINDENINAVYIPLPNALHAEWIKQSLKKGLHVLAEKSLACTLNDVIKLNELAEKKSLVLFENFQFRFHNQLEYIIQLVNSGLIGELKCVKSSFGFPPFANNNNIRYNIKLGGGSLLDAGAYTLKIAQIFMGNDIFVKASNLFIDKDKGVDISGGAFLSQKSGNLFAEVAFGFDHHYQCNIELWGSKGKIYTNRIFTAPPGYEPIIEVETNQGKETIKLPADNHFIKMLTYFYELICSKKDKENEYTQNINQARLISELKSKANE